MNLLTTLNSTIASLLDTAAVHANKVLPIKGAWVGYMPGRLSGLMLGKMAQAVYCRWVDLKPV